MAPPVAGSDHTAQVIFLPMISRRLKQRTRASVMKTDYEAMRQILNSISWRELFSLCNDVDDYVNVFMDVIVSAKGRASYSCRRRPGSINFPPAILSLIYKKRHLWYKSQKSGDRTQYYDARNKCRQAIKKFSADYEKSVINSGNFKSFYKYMNLKLGRSKNATESMGIGSHSASESAEIFSAEFTRNFSAREPIDVDKVMREAEDTGLRLNCSFDDVTTALKQCANSAAGQDGISFKLIKELSKQLLTPLCIIYQQSICQSKFPTQWKLANVNPIFKGKGNKEEPASYRPVSMCSCLGKVLEVIVKNQLQNHIDATYPLSSVQHGFQKGLSTLTNLLSCEATIAKYMNGRSAFDVITFDFKRAFDKVPHSLLIESLSQRHMHKWTLNWISSFLSGRRQQVVFGGVRSRSTEVTSGVIQGSVLGPQFFSIFIDSLLCKISKLIPETYAYADDIKFVNGVTDEDYLISSAAIDIVSTWSAANKMPLSADKCIVWHYGANNPNRIYKIDGQPLPGSADFKDLGILRSIPNMYSKHVAYVASSNRRLSGLISRCLTNSDLEVKWRAFNIYVKPRLMYASSVWSPHYVYEKKAIENVQRRFSKRLPGMASLSYEQRLLELSITTLEHARVDADLLFLFRTINGLHGVNLNTIGLQLSPNNERSGCCRLLQPRPITNSVGNLFLFRSARLWNSLPKDILLSSSIKQFKESLHSMHLSSYMI